MRLPALIPVVTVAAMALSAPAGAAAETCTVPVAQPTGETVAASIVATVCLANQERAAAGVPPLTLDMGLLAVASGYARRMVAEQFFAHVAPDGSSLETRLGVIGYEPDMAGENLYWGEAAMATPAQAVQGWMHSEEHRQNLLDPAFRRVGVGIAIGAPKPGIGVAATYVADFDSGAGAAARASTVSEAPAPEAEAAVLPIHPRSAVRAWFAAARRGDAKGFCRLEDNRMLASVYGTGGRTGLRSCANAFRAVDGLPGAEELSFSNARTRGVRSSMTVLARGQRVVVTLRKFNGHWKIDTVAR